MRFLKLNSIPLTLLSSLKSALIYEKFENFVQSENSFVQIIVIYDFYAKYTFIEQNYFLLNRIFFGALKVSPSLFMKFFSAPLFLPTCFYCPLVVVVVVFLIVLVLLLLFFLSVVGLKHVIILPCPDKLLLISFFVCDFH